MATPDQIPPTLESSLRAGYLLSHAPKGEEIVISGLSGSFPESENVYELRDNLFNKKDTITADTRRWDFEHPEIPKHSGKIPVIGKLDSAFFGIHHKQATVMDTVGRLTLEKTFEAILDAGMNLEEIRGTKTGVFLGSCFCEHHLKWFYVDPCAEALYGSNRSTFAQRISYWLGIDGPCYLLDTACSSSHYAFDHGYRAIRDGLCENAIVLGCNTVLHPIISVQFNRLGVLNEDGKCKCFDEGANGYTRSEAICAVILQKAKNAKRIYATVIHSKSNCDGYNEEGITYPSGPMQQVLLNEFYKECDVDPTSINFVEAHGTGTKVGDPEELRSLESVFCKGRKNTLLIGSVKSNIGHTESASGLCSITKVIIANETGYIPPNINYSKPRKELAVLVNGKIKVVTEKTKWNGGLVGVNCFGFGGANCHLLLRSNTKEKINFGIPKDDLPRLVCFSGRTREALATIINDLSSRPLDAEFVRLFHEIFKYNIDGHYYRSYVNMTKNQKITSKISTYDGVPKPIWFVFSGLGSQWAGMGTAMMKIPIFCSTIDKCQEIVAPKGINIVNIIISKDTKTFEDNVNITVGITAIQLALVDLLKVIQVKPDHMIGYSIGEIACAYADECLTLEQAILSSYYIGLASKDMKTDAELLRNLKKLIPSPKERSSTWLTTTENTKLAKHCSAEYLVHSLSCSVTLKQSIPKDAVVIEVAPHGHLQSLLKQAFGEDVVTIALLQKDYQDNIQAFSSAIGELYLAGCNPRMEYMYPDIQFPVSRGTPMISPLIQWNHDITWHVPRYEEDIKSAKYCGSWNYTITMNENKRFVAGHVIDGRILYPATGYLLLVWKTLAQILNSSNEKVPVIFEDVSFLRATNIPKEGRIYMLVMLHAASGKFEIIESEQPVVKGRIRFADKALLKKKTCNLPIPHPREKDYYKKLTSKDIYKELRLRGYNYSGLFRGIKSCDLTASVGELAWNNNIITFMDTMLQMKILQADTRGLFIPTSIQKLVINADKHMESIQKNEDGEFVPVYAYKHLNTIVSGGIEITGVQVNAISRRKPLGEPVLETYKFISNDNDRLTLEESVRVIVQLAFENIPNIKIRTAELLEESNVEDTLLSTLVQSVLGDLPLIQADINVLTTKTLEEMPGITISDKKLDTETNCLLVIATNLINRTSVLQTAFNALVEGGFIILRESIDMDLTKLDLNDVEIILQHKLMNEQIILIRKSSKINFQTTVDVTNATDNLNWLPVLQKSVKNDPNTIVYSQGDEFSGILGLVNCIRREPGTDGVRCFFIMDKDAPKFNLRNNFYSSQLKKGLAINVMKEGVWGTYRHILLTTRTNIKVEHAYVNVTVRGDLSSLKWLEGNLHTGIKPPSNYMLVHVYYSALNFRDIMTSTGRLAPEVVARGRFQQECVQGLEFAGRLEDGRRVMGMVPHGGLSTMVLAETQFLWDIPDQWSFEEAVTIPIVYGTVTYAMIIEGKLQPGQSILIHAGTGGIGQAAINMALFYECNVFTTVGTQEKRDFIKATWPQIKDSHIGNSRDTSFEQMIMVETQGRGVDFVLNSLSEEKLQASIRCLAHGGKFLEIGKFDLANDNPMPLSLFKKEASFHGIMLDQLFYATGRMKKDLSSGLQNSIKQGAVKPLTRHVFKNDEIEEAFRFMAAGKHMGKVLIKIRDEEPERIVKPPRKLKTAIPRHISSLNGTYIITGGLGGFGLELTDWLVLRGTRQFILTSRKGITTGYQAMRVKTWRSYGVQINISTADISTFEGCKSLIVEAKEMGPVEGVFNLAVILKDALLDNQTKQNYEISFAPKPVATKHLDELTRKLCPELKMFVIFSSVSCGRGNAGQTNYGMGNSIMERICEQRKKDGFPALAVEWGAIGEVGLVAEMQENHGELEIGGTLQQRISSCLSVLDQFLKQDDPIVSSMVVAEKKRTGGAGGNIIDAVGNILGIHDLKTVSFHSSLAELGMDSIMAVEIKQTLEREFEVFLTPQDIRSLSFNRLQQIAAEKQSSIPCIKDGSMLSETGVLFMFRNLGDESISKEPFMVLSSKANSESRNKVILIPGIEGMASVLEPLANNIDAQSICLQLGFGNLDGTLPGMANALLKRTLHQLQDSNTFNLVGYSYGAAITLELAALLEAKGKVGNIVLIDGSPSMLRDMANLQLTTDNENNFQNAVLYAILNLYIVGEEADFLRLAYENCTTWETKVNAFVENVPKYIKYTRKYQIAACEAIYQRMKAITNYEPTLGKLKSNIKLVKPQSPSFMHPEEDFGLSAFSINPVEVVIVEGNHVTIVESKDCAEEINKIFREEIKI